MTKPIVAIVGRPNVGKSTLFNRLAGERLAVVDDTPGTTRDRLQAESDWNGRVFTIVDTGGIEVLPERATRGDAKLDAHTPLSISSAEFVPQIRQQAEIAVSAADALIFIVDSETGITSADQVVADVLRRAQRTKDGESYPPILVVANKADNNEREMTSHEFYALGLGEVYPISAIHGIGVGDMLDALVESFPSQEEEEDESIKIAIVGRPNVGKSSLLNAVLGEERVIVSPVPGTTRDAIDTSIRYADLDLTLIDTAGIRRRGHIEPGVEKYSVLRAMRAIGRCDVALLLIDAVEGVTAQDAHIAGYILEENKSVVLLVNKWDMIQPGLRPGSEDKPTQKEEEFAYALRNALNFLDYVPVLFISAKSGLRVEDVLPLALRVQEERLVRIPTAEVNRILREAIDKQAPPTKAGKRLKIFYGSQVRSDPPTFLFHVNDPKLVHFSYERYLENQIRKVYHFLGTPLRLSFRKRGKDRE